MGGIGEVDGREGDPVVRDGEVVLDAKGSPGSTMTDLGFLDGGIFIEHRLAAELVDTGVDVSSQVWEDRALQVLVFEDDGSPGVVGFCAGQTGPKSVGIVELGGRIHIEGRIRIGLPFLVGGQRDRAHGDSGLSLQVRLYAEEAGAKERSPCRQFSKV
jgi:hypothetical protein